ncbi:uncharacterized methyltransferase C25B8.09 [Octopus sinensis]|uniref:Uncharacterized methyltransferase C25B8.09 n=1 Tax=Octopus sinensis TaxID=2607531 RepID=A0A6P7TM67_9MOLL|nr:uncharacterized methyltransferase C25B8.09 [Octopus sinensis]XP_036370511.1 uncharacterized methyltransferase C25B8.09 [Octopus sinensis]
MDSEQTVGSGISKVHSMAVSGFTKNSADLYNQGRPYYTDQTIEEIIKRSQLIDLESTANISYDVLELGAGTGKFTQKLYPRLKQMRKEKNKPLKYLATEPSEGFLSALQESFPDVETAVASATCLKVPDHSVRVVAAAQSFHWFATEEALKEIHRILVPDGMLILVWNRADRRIPWIEAATNLLLENYPPNIPRESSEEWKKVFESFTDFRQQFYTQPSSPVIQGTKSTVLNYFLSVSVIASLANPEKEKVEDNFVKLLNKWFPGSTEETPVEFPFQTHLYGFVKQ